MANTIVVGCRLPNGLVLRAVDATGAERRVLLNGQNSAMGGAVWIAPTLCGYTDVDEGFWDAWLKINKDFPALKSGAIFAQKNVESARSKADEMKNEKTGLEQVKRKTKDINPADKD